MKRIRISTLSAMALFVGLFISLSASAQTIRQSTLYIDNGSGTFLELVASSLTGSTNRTINFGNPGVDVTLVETPSSVTPAAGDIMYWDASNNTWKRLAVGTGVLEAGTTPGYGKVDLGNSSYVTGVLGISNGGSGVNGSNSATFPADNTIFAGSSSGSTTAPSFRAIVAADLKSPVVNNEVLGTDGSGNLIWSAAGSGTVNQVVAGTGISVSPATSGSGSYTVNVSGSYAGGSSIATVGTITSGTWQSSTPVGAGYGGTGISNYSIGDMLYANGTSSLTTLGIGTNPNYIMTVNSSHTAPQWTDPSTITVGTATSANEINGNSIPANATGFLYNNGSGTLSWAAALSASGNNTFTGTNDFQQNNIGSTYTADPNIANNTNTTSGTAGNVGQQSPSLEFDAHGWNTGALVDTEYSARQTLLPYDGNPVTGVLAWDFRNASSGTWQNAMQLVDSQTIAPIQSATLKLGSTGTTKRVGRLSFADGSSANRGALGTATLTAAQAWTLPNASGTIALVGGTANYSSNFDTLGINTSTPNTNLDVNGGVAFRTSIDNSSTGATLSAVNAANKNCIIYTAEGSSNFTITGFANGVNGQRLQVINEGTGKMTIANQSGTESTAANRINTLAGGDVTLKDTGSISFVYDAGTSRWIMQPAMANTITGLAAVGINYSLETSPQSNTTTATLDPNLRFTAIAGATYEVHGVVVFASMSNQDVDSMGFSTGSTSSTISVTAIGFANVSGNTGLTGTGLISEDYTTGNSAEFISSGKMSSGTNVYIVSGIIKPAVSGTVAFVTKNGDTSGNIASNSYMSFTRVQ